MQAGNSFLWEESLTVAPDVSGGSVHDDLSSLVPWDNLDLVS